MSRSITKTDSYLDRLVKLIPSEIVAAYLFLEANLIGLGQNVIIAVIIILFVFCILYMRILREVMKWSQVIFSSLSFLVWVYAVAPREILGDLYSPQIATIIMVLWTLAIPFFVKEESQGGSPAMA